MEDANCLAVGSNEPSDDLAPENVCCTVGICLPIITESKKYEPVQSL